MAWASGPPPPSHLAAANHLEIIKEIYFPHSLGLLYSAFTYYTGFKVNSGEYKVMGLAPYGSPRFAKQILDHLIDLKADGSFRLNLDYFDYCTGLTMTNSKFDSLFEGPRRKPEELLTQRHMDLAASVQVVLEEVILRMTRALATETEAREFVSSGRSSPQLRGEWATTAGRPFRKDLDSTCGRRCRRGAWRSTCRLSLVQRPAA